jgi:hypothetical protein
MCKYTLCNIYKNSIILIGSAKMSLYTKIKHWFIFTKLIKIKLVQIPRGRVINSYL